MPEEALEDGVARPFTLARYLDIIRRRHLLFLSLLFLGWATVFGSSWVLPARYKSSTLILVEEPSLPKSYVVPNVNDDLQHRLQSITQQILSRSRLLFIIDKLHLYQGKHEPSNPDRRVELMRKDIEIELVKGPQDEITAFRVNYRAPEPRVAQQVTGELTNLFIDENLKIRQDQSENTTRFIESQLTSARASLADQDAKVRAFKTAHEGELPSQQQSNLQILSGLQSQLQNERDALNAARQQSVYHQSLIEQYRALNGMHQARTTEGPSDLESIEQQINRLSLKLRDLKTRYADQYPELQQVKAELVAAEKTRDQIIKRTKGSPREKMADSEGRSRVLEDPARNAPLLQLESQLKADQLEISTRQAAIDNLQSRINQYQMRLSQEPAVSEQLSDLTRGYEQSQANYNDLLKKESDSQMATSMEQMQQGERFTMIDPPSLPLRPDFPNRLKMCGAGLGTGVALGFLVVAFLEVLDDRLYTNGEIERLIPMADMYEIPEIPNSSEMEHKRFRAALGWAMALTITCAIISGAAFSYLHP